jgi:MoaA/NifB/PqqE/SkfB family radical SAM enzyme
MASAYQKIKLLQGLLTGEYAYTGPFHVVVGLTSRCNLRCVGCRYHSVFAQRQKITDETLTDEYLPFETMETLCLDLRRLRCSALLLMGEGEPLLHPRILDIVSLVKGMGFHATIITNGTLLTEEMLEGFIKRGLDCLQVSLWAGSAAEYENQ